MGEKRKLIDDVLIRDKNATAEMNIRKEDWKDLKSLGVLETTAVSSRRGQ